MCNLHIEEFKHTSGGKIFAWRHFRAQVAAFCCGRYCIYCVTVY